LSYPALTLLHFVQYLSFHRIIQVIRKSDNKVYALKRVKINKMSKKEIADALNEIRFLASIRHKNIVGFLEAFLENNETELCIVMEFCGCGDLAQKVERYKRRRQYIDEDVIWRYMIQSLKALANLHEKNICHRDLKVANSFLAEDGSVKIGDMNVSKRLEKGQLKTQIGTPYYMSPEIWNNRAYDFSSDIWSLGCMMYELCALKPPFQGNSFPELKRAVIAGRYTPIPSKYSEPLGRVIGMMLRINARERPSAAKLLTSVDLASKLHLDEPAASAAAAQPSSRDMHMALMETIKVPQNLRKLNAGLPKPCYPDARPNSPKAWTVAEQVHANKKKVGAVVPPLPSADVENVPPPPISEVPSVEKIMIPTEVLKEKKAPSAAALADYYIRRPLAPADDSTNQSNVAPAMVTPAPPQAPAPEKRGYADYRHIQSRYAQVPPPKVNRELEPIPNPPTAKAQARVPYGAPQAQPQPQPSKIAGHPVRVQYQHRMW
jgi:serine/threonine protein kinase